MKYLDWEIEECIDCLERSARETGNTHNEMMRVRNPDFNAPNAYRATNSWHAAEIIRELQAEIAALKAEHIRVKRAWQEDYLLLDEVCREAISLENQLKQKCQ